MQLVVSSPEVLHRRSLFVQKFDAESTDYAIFELMKTGIMAAAQMSVLSFL